MRCRGNGREALPGKQPGDGGPGARRDRAAEQSGGGRGAEQPFRSLARPLAAGGAQCSGEAPSPPARRVGAGQSGPASGGGTSGGAAVYRGSGVRLRSGPRGRARGRAGVAEARSQPALVVTEFLRDRAPLPRAVRHDSQRPRGCLACASRGRLWMRVLQSCRGPGSCLAPRPASAAWVRALCFRAPGPGVSLLKQNKQQITGRAVSASVQKRGATAVRVVNSVQQK